MNSLSPIDTRDRGLAPWPLADSISEDLSSEIMTHIESLAKRQLTGFPRLNDPSVFGNNVKPGYREGPTLFLEDHQGIQLMPPEGFASHEYRILGLARPGDFCLISKQRNASFERYLGKLFGGAQPVILKVDRGDIRLRRTLAAACLENETAMSQLVDAASIAGTLNICPYLSSGYDWLLGAEIARRSGCPVQICAPLPQLSRLVNDKLWFAHQVRAIMGKDAVPPTYSVYGPIAAATILSRLARQYEKLIIKLPASAGSMGNLVLESAIVRSVSLTELRNNILLRLRLMGWDDRYPILVGVWEAAAIASPSAQVWVPQANIGPPIIEGIFGQILSGERQSFVGASQIALPFELQARFCRQALAISTFFQKLGYVGRLSLDALLTGTGLESAELHWIECNGRWGGVSIPMMVARRLVGTRNPMKLVIVQRALHDQSIPDFEDVLQRLERWLYADHHRQGIVFLEPTGMEQPNVTFLVIAPSDEAAEHMATTALEAIGS
ncbi:hypothetical protein [Altererythrobacter sp. ZODW24]|uniref:preATP grasp domain-containing protein n=1 Tax=Altererythrobacter sp. ZODW24 TaxID=2185142 RepID=UPI000DF7BD1A|nr:hypothetical protein [Altererythrobacter sp. ZODW24]